MKIIISCDVVFDEKVTWSWNQNDIKGNIPVGFGNDEKEQQLVEDEQHEEVTQNVPTADQSSLAAKSQKSQHVR